MDTKLTLKLEDSLIKRAKFYAKRRNTSLSKLVGKFFSTLETKEKRKEELAPLVKELSGIVDRKLDLPLKKAREIRLIKKYL